MSSSHRLRIGIVGIGFGQQVHLPVFQAHPQCEVAAIAAGRRERADAVAAKYGIRRAFGSWQELVESAEIDVVSIATPPSIQGSIIHASLLRGKPVFCEKPVASAAAQVSTLVQLAQQRQIANMVDFEFPEIPSWQRAKAILTSGQLGRLRHAAVSWNVETYANKLGLNSWKTQSEEGGGALNAFVSHSFHYLEWFLGKIIRLSARTGRAPGDTRSGDSLCMLALELESGCLVSLSVSSHAFLGTGHKLEFYGDEGTMVLENTTSDYIKGFDLYYGSRTSKQLETVPVAKFSDYADGRITAVSGLAARFIEWVITGQAASPTLADGLRVQQLLDAAQQSNQLGCWLNLTEES